MQHRHLSVVLLLLIAPLPEAIQKSLRGQVVGLLRPNHGYQHLSLRSHPVTFPGHFSNTSLTNCVKILTIPTSGRIPVCCRAITTTFGYDCINISLILYQVSILFFRLIE